MNEHFQRTLSAWAEGDLPSALAHVRQAAEQEPQHLVYTEALIYLNRVSTQGRQNVYVSPQGFSAFIRGGGNVGLYRETSAALKQVYAMFGPLTLLDIGVGDGLALLPALTENVRQLDLLEPSAALLAQTQTTLMGWDVVTRAHNATLQAFVAAPDQQNRHWDLAQATFSLQSLPPQDRPTLLRWLCQHVDRMLMVEFDAPTYAGSADPADFLSPRRIDYVVARYLRGLAEYANDNTEDESVRQGFLMPVFFGYFDRSAHRTNWEVPAQDWGRLLREAGFGRVDIRPVFDYWWAPACLIDAL